MDNLFFPGPVDAVKPVECLVFWQRLFQEGQNVDLELCFTEAKIEETIFQ